MNDEVDPNVGFLAHVGIDAHISLDDEGKTLVVIATAQYEKRHNLIDRWYTRVFERDGFSYFRERPRGTGTTAI